MNESEKILKLERELEECREENETKSEFLSMVIHQLRTPLSGIKWTFKMLLDGDLGAFSDEQRTIVARGAESNDRVIKLLQEVSDANKSEQWEFVYNFKETDMEQFVEDLITEFLEMARVNHVSLVFKRPDKPLPSLFIDSDKLGTALQNILENAIRYNREDGTVTVTLEQDTEKIKIVVGDTGIGIPADIQNQIATKFFRAKNAIAKHHDGSGLGLFTAKNIIERHQGELIIASTEGLGTTITITLPLVE